MQLLNNISLKGRLIFIQSVTAFVAVLICAFIFVINDIKIFKESAVRKMYSVVRIIGDNSVSPLQFLDREAANNILQNLDKEPDIKDAIVLDKKGIVFGRYTQDGTKAAPFTIADTTKLISSAFSGKELFVSYKVFQKDQFLGTVVLRAELSDINKIIFNYVLTAVFVLLAGLLAALIISNFLQRSISTRLLLLVSKTKEIAGSGNYSIRVPAEGNDEIATLSKGFNNMLEEIEKRGTSLEEANIGLEQKIEERTVELEATNKELEQFVYVASHDLQEPLRTISNFVTLLEEKDSVKVDEETRQYLKYIVNAANRMRTLIKDLLDLSRIGRNIKISEVDTNSVLQEVIAQLEMSINENNVKITSTQLPVLRGNEIELKQLFQNLLSNAIKFRKKNYKPEIHIAAEERASEYYFTVKDNGIGIEEKFKDRIFIIFQRLYSDAEYAGTGIGLATCKKIVGLHNGKIWVESKLGEGSTFCFTISKSI